MGGYSAQCDCGKWFINPQGYKDHCTATSCVHHPERVGGKKSCRQDRLDVMHDLLTETHGDLTLHECIDGLHKGKWIVWQGDQVVCVGDEEWARRHLPGGDRTPHP